MSDEKIIRLVSVSEGGQGLYEAIMALLEEWADRVDLEHMSGCPEIAKYTVLRNSITFED